MIHFETSMVLSPHVTVGIPTSGITLRDNADTIKIFNVVRLSVVNCNLIRPLGDLP